MYYSELRLLAFHMRQKIYLNPLHRFIWFPLVDGAASISAAILVFVLLLGPLAIDGLPKPISIAGVSGWHAYLACALLVLLSWLLWRNAAAGNYYNDASAYPRTIGAVLLIWVALLVDSKLGLAHRLLITTALRSNRADGEIVLSASAIVFMISTTSFFLAKADDLLQKCGGRLSAICSSLSDPVRKMGQPPQYERVNSVVRECLLDLSKLGDLRLSSRSQKEVQRLGELLTTIYDFLLRHDALLLSERSPATQSLKDFARKLELR
jgi:hypothetical protein